MNLLVAVGLLFVFIVYVDGFNLTKFVKKHCTLEPARRERIELKCSNFKFSEEDIEDIQSNDFIITNLTKMHFQHCDIGIVNDNFFAKFPLVEEFRFDSVFFSTTPNSKGFVLPSPLKVTDIIITDGKWTHTRNCNFLKSMPDLDFVHFGTVTMEHKIIDANFFQNNPKISWMTWRNIGIEEFEEGIFDGLQELVTLFIEGAVFKVLPRNLFAKATKLKILYLDNCYFNQVPDLIYPKSLSTLYLSFNNITTLTAQSFKNMENITSLKLDHNNIGNFWLEVFDEMKNLTVLDLSYNHITEISKDHFWKLEQMILIDLRFNDIKSTDLEEFASVNVMLHPSRKKETEEEYKTFNDKTNNHCGCGHAWAVLILFLGIFGGGIGLIAWTSSITKLKRVFGYRMNRMDEDDRNLL